jgi:TatD DNase family protein
VSFVDTHCHLNLDIFDKTIDQVVERAQDAGVIKIVVPGIDIDTSRKAVELASRFEFIYAAVGTHPNEADKFEESHIKVFEEFLREPKVVAVGEIGLDFYHHPETESRQKILLNGMLTLATQFNKPVILHSRNSLTTLMAIVSNWIESQQPTDNRFFGVFHGFEGNFSQGIEIQLMKMALGIGGPVTFKNAIDKQNMVRALGIQNLVLETDSPLLSPHPFRGQTNEPYRIPVIAEKVASLLEIPMEQVSEITGQNAHSLFRWDEIN